MKRFLVSSFAIALAFVFLLGCHRGKYASIQGTYHLDEQMGEMEIHSDGKVLFKKLGMEGQANIKDDKIAVQCAHVTYFFTKKGNTLVSGAHDVPPELLPKPVASSQQVPPPPQPPASSLPATEPSH